VENLVKFVKTNFLAGRTFYDDADLEEECASWLQRVNAERPSDATEQLPATLLAAGRPHFKPLPAVAHDYGIFDSVLVTRESLVTIATNRYSVPAHLVGQALTARLHQERIDLFQGVECVASHARHRGRHARIVVPEHFEAVFAVKPRARVMVYRDWLVGLSEGAAAYVSLLCQKRYAEMDAQIPALYELAQRVGRGEFLAALDVAAEQGIVGVEYLRALLALPVPAAQRTDIGAVFPRLRAVPSQREVERDLASYEAYVANRLSADEGAVRVGGPR